MQKLTSLLTSLLLASAAHAATYSLTLPTPPSAGPARYMGEGPGSTTPPPACISPTRGTLGYNNSSLLLNNKPWLPVMGEIHYSRLPESEWRDALLKMKAGGISVVASYVFWIHHEEIRGQFTWQGQKNLRHFVELCKELDLPCIIRMGPWCHGEVRNGGMPDWADAMPKKRSADPAFLAAVDPLYAQISEQLKGLLWKDGGPVIGVQVDNEWGGDQNYLLALKILAISKGIAVPLYIKTGWPKPRVEPPFGELMPLFGNYAEGFWDRQLTSMPGNYWQAFHFSQNRTDTAVASDIFGQRAQGESAETLSYPYLTCELGGGMPSSYHRRIHISPMDVYSIPLVRVGSGSNLPGYYMYHGGTNPDGLTTTMMQETQSRGMHNDLPYKTYDFQAPLGEFGQINESYHTLRKLHTFLHDYQDTLAPMTTVFPDYKPAKDDTTTVRYAVRHDGKSGFLFVNNYQRGIDMPAKPDTIFEIRFPSRALRIPERGSLTIPANTSFVLPIDTHHYRLAQPLGHVNDGSISINFYMQIPGIPLESLALLPYMNLNPDDPKERDIMAAQGLVREVQKFELNKAYVADKTQPLADPKTGKPNPSKVGSVAYYIDQNRAAQLHKATLDNKQYALFTKANLTIDGTTLRLTSSNPDDLTLDAIPPLKTKIISKAVIPTLPAPTFTQTQKPGPLRTIKMGSQKVAEAPTDDDFAGNQPATYTIQLPDLAKAPHTLLRLSYTGDVARIYAGDKLLTDNFYNKDPFDLGLWRIPPNTKELTLKILPLQKSAPIFIDRGMPDFHNADTACSLDQLELIPQHTLTLEAQP